MRDVCVRRRDNRDLSPREGRSVDAMNISIRYSGFICAILAIVYLFTFGGYFLAINKSYKDYQNKNETKKNYN